MSRGAESGTRQQRLAAKLRENLRRRKKQAEARKPDHDPPPKNASDKAKSR
jgi:hypothetical protein